MRSIKSRIQISILAVVLIGSTLIGVITALLNASGIDSLMEKTLGPATQMAANAVEWRMNNYWTALQEAAASDVFIESVPDAPELVPVRDEIAARNGFLYTGKMDADGFSSMGVSFAEEDYFQQCKATMQPYISDIMSDGTQMIFLLEVPIIINDRFEGLVYGGISADFLTDIVVNLAMGEDGVAYVLDHRGNVIGHREKSVVEEGSNMIEAAKSDPSAADVAAVNQRMIEGETGFGRYQFYGDNKFVGFAPIGGNQHWSIAIEASQHEFKATLDRSIMVTIWVILAVVIASFPVALLLARSISRPIRTCINRLELLATGDIHTPVLAVKSSGEPAELTEALRTTVTRLCAVVQSVSYHLEKMSEGSFHEEITENYEGDFSQIEKSIRGIQSSLRNILSQIHQSVDAVSSSASQMADGAQSLSQGATEQASAIEELSATVTTIAETAKQTAANTDEVNQYVNQASDQLAVSMEHVGDLNAAMEKISASSEKIANIIDTIENIAFQTNILALNASVEAARAGSAGKGFAVVADEVRTLANKSDEAAKAVKTLIEESIAVVAEGSQVVYNVTDSLNKTSESAGHMTEKMSIVAEAVSSQTSDIEQVTLGLDQISDVVQTTSATAEESAAISQELATQSQRLKTLSDRFNLN